MSISIINESENTVANLSVGEVHDKLNPVLWDDKSKLWPEVKQHVLDIVDEFRNSLDIDLDVVDIQIVGSNASFNYNEHSDIDIHIIANFDDMGTPETVVQQAMNATKTQFNKEYDIKFRGLDVEVYVENINSATRSNGIYSVMRDKWIKYPHKLDVPNVDLEPELSDMRSEVNAALISKDAAQIKLMINRLYLMRQDSLAVNGEFGRGNLIFKQIRNDGLLDGLKNKLKEIRSDELSIESINESVEPESTSTWRVNIIVGAKSGTDCANFVHDIIDVVDEALKSKDITHEPISIFDVERYIPDEKEDNNDYWSLPIIINKDNYDYETLCLDIADAIDSFDLCNYYDNDDSGVLCCYQIESR